MVDLVKLKRVIDIEYCDVVKNTVISHGKLRVFMTDNSVADIWFSRVIPGRYSYHWERRHIDGKIYRYDNFPDPQWEGVSTFPEHFHNGYQNNVQESRINNDPLLAIHQFMDFIKGSLS